MILLFSSTEKLSCPEFITYYNQFYKHLLKRYLTNKYKSYQQAIIKFNKLESIISMCYESRKLCEIEVFGRIDINQLNEIVIEVFNLLK